MSVRGISVTPFSFQVQISYSNTMEMIREYFL